MLIVYAWGTVELKTEFGAQALGLRAQGSEFTTSFGQSSRSSLLDEGNWTFPMRQVGNYCKKEYPATACQPGWAFLHCKGPREAQHH